MTQQRSNQLGPEAAPPVVSGGDDQGTDMPRRCTCNTASFDERDHAIGCAAGTKPPLSSNPAARSGQADIMRLSF